MRWLAAVLLLVFAASLPEIRYFQFERPVDKPAQSAGQTCAAIDPNIFAHASPALADLRLYQGSAETPYIVLAAAYDASTTQNVPVLNPGRSGNQTVFDAQMPPGPYTDVQLQIDGHDFLAAVTISGSQTETETPTTRLGSFTIFDLTKQRLGRSTVLHLPQSDFRFLHFQIAGPIAPQDVTGISMVKMPARQPKFVTIASTATGTQKGRDSVFEFTVPARVPVERIVFMPGAQPTNFSRNVEVRVVPTARAHADDDSEPPQPFSTTGNILRVHSVQNGHRIDEEQLSVDAPQVDYDGPATWRVTIENGDDAPIQIASVRLEMTERDLCFDATAAGVYTLYYGDAALAAPQYDYATLFVLAADASAAQLGAEIANPAYQPRPDGRPFTEKHPALLWIALIVVMVILGLIAIRSVKATQGKRP